MPCWIYVRGDESATICSEAADVIVKRVEDSAPEAFVPVSLLPHAHDDHEVRTAYVRAQDVVQVMPLHPRQAEDFLDDPPDWW